jgi:recombination protein RecT
MEIQKTKKLDIRSYIQSEGVKAQLAMVLPRHLTPDRMARVTCTAIMRNPKLLECTPESLLQAMMLCSQMGLEPDGRNAHMIPYGTNVQLILDWKGLVALAERNGVKNIRAVAVCDKDEFSFSIEDGIPKLRHVINWKAERGAAYAYYGTCVRNDQFDVEVMTKGEVDKIRQRSKASGSGPWVTDYDEMAKKTVLRRMSKRWDISPEVADAMNQDFDTPADVKAKPSMPVVLSPLALPETNDDLEDLKPVEKAQDPTPAAPAEQPPAATAFPPDDASECLKVIETYSKSADVSHKQIMAFLYETKFADATKHKELSELSTAKLQRIIAKWPEMVEKIKAMAV